MATPKITNPNLHDILSRHLPEDIVHDILFIRLSIKDLLRSTSVCKSWLSLISSPDFIRTHLDKSTNDLHFSHHRLLLSRRNNIDVHVLDAYLTFQSRSLYTESTWLDLDHPENIVKFVGYSNGLACLLCDNYNDNYNLTLWNPSTRKSRILPRVDMNLKNPCTTYGFCYDELNDHFKVFVICSLAYEHEFSVYSSKSDDWSMIEDFPFAEMLSECNFVNGVMYGVLNDQNYQKSKIIVCIDSKVNTCQETLQPSYGEGVRDWSLGTFGKNLSVVCKFDTRADLWVMEECGAEKFWAKLFSIPCMDVLTRGKDLKPVWIFVNGDILVKFDSKLLLYDSRDQKYKDLLQNDYGEAVDVYTYVESLVSP